MEKTKERNKSFAQVHSEMLSICMGYYLLENHTTSEICEEYLRLFGWKPSAREWRRYKDWFNNEFRKGNSDWYIIGTKDGYRMTDDKELIEADCKRKRRLAVAMLWRVSNTKQRAALQDMYQLELNFKEEAEDGEC